MEKGNNRIQTDESRVDRLKLFCSRMAQGAQVREVWDLYEEDVLSVTPEETMVLVDHIMEQESDLDSVKVLVSKLMNTFAKSLKNHAKRFREGNEYIAEMVMENKNIDTILSSIRPQLVLLNANQDDTAARDLLISYMNDLTAANQHYIDKENILFPAVERYVHEHRCVQLMWSIHDDIRTSIKQITQLLGSDTLDMIQLNKFFGMLFFDVRGMIFREEFVLIPVLERMFTKEIWENLRTYKAEGYEKQITWSTSESGIQLPTGLLQAEQLIQIFNHLPVDITLIDSDDRVVFFNTPENRVFPRNYGVIGRDVKNCHPPKSIAVVERILNAFKRGERTTAEFRILMHEKYLLIRYIALYTEKGEYDGVLEVLQDITEITKMTGERRLLDWQ